MPGNMSEKFVPSVANVARAPLRGVSVVQGEEFDRLHAYDAVRVVAEQVWAVWRKVSLLRRSQHLLAKPTTGGS